MLPDYLNSYDPLKERLSGSNEKNQEKIKDALQQILSGRAGNPEFGAVDGSAEHIALRMLGGNTGRFAGNYVIKNYDDLDPMVKDMVPLYGKDITETEGALEKQKEMPVLPRVVESARRRQSERRAKAVERQEAKKLTLDEIRRKHEKAVREEPDGGVSQEGAYEEEFINSFVGRPAKKRRFFSANQNPDTENDMDNIGYQEGGTVPVDAQGNVPPQAVAGDVVNGAPMGMVDVPNGGGPVDDGVPTELPEGAVVINAAAIRLHGTETIDNLINTAVDELLSEGVQISMQDPNPEDNVPVAISNGEYIIPPEVAEKIGYKKLEDMNERGRAYLQKQEAQEKQQAEAQQQPSQPPQQPPEGFMGAQMPPEQGAAPPAPVQSEEQAMAMMGMMDGGRVPYAEGTGFVGKLFSGFGQAFKEAFFPFGSSDFDPAESAVDKMLMVPTAPKGKVTVGDISSTGLPDALVGKSFKSIGDMEFGGGYQEKFDKARKAAASPASIKENPQYRNAPSKRKKADGGRVNYAVGSNTAVEAPTPPAVETAEVEDAKSFNSEEMSAFGNAFAQAYKQTFMPESENLTEGVPQRNYADSFITDTDPLRSSSVLPETFRPQAGKAQSYRPQAVAEGGFVGDYNYAQPQQATMGTPFPNAVDSNPQQSQSFLRPNDAKKKFRVGLADGTTTPKPKDKPPYALPLSPEQEELLNDQTFLNEFANGDREAAERIFTQRTDHYAITQDGRPEVKIYDWKLKKFLPYTDNGGNKTIGGINVQDKSHKLNKSKGVSISEYLVAHTSHLKKANDWVTNNPSYEPIREVIVDMKFNMKPNGFNQFIKQRFGKAVEEGNFDVASKELLIGKNENSPSNYATQVPNRAKANSKRLKSLGQQFFKEKYPDITENQYTNNISFSTKAEDMSMEPSDSFVPLPVKFNVSQRTAIQNAENAEKQKDIHNARVDKMLGRLPPGTSPGFTGF